jgi:hypothetical protein
MAAMNPAQHCHRKPHKYVETRLRCDLDVGNREYEVIVISVPADTLDILKPYEPLVSIAEGQRLGRAIRIQLVD